jgi:decaprenylphospho-beta-D-erythro-pentofuranosid-2-ulose 2-reductase
VSTARPAIRTALVLGGTSDIAAAVLEDLAACGLEQVVLAVRDPSAIEPGVLPGVSVHAVRWDALDADGHEQLLAESVEVTGGLDLVLCAVGMLGHHAGISMAPTEVDRMVRTNFAGPAAALAACGEHLRRRGTGAIVVLSSVAGVRPRRSNYVYGSSKAGLDAFTRGLADALAGTAVQVLVVRPGFVRSRMTEGLDPAPFASTPDAVAAAVVRGLSRGRSTTVWVPSLLGPLFAVLVNVPGSLWRRIAGDR